MGLRDLFKRQLRTVVEWKEQNGQLLFHLMETTTDEIKNASKLIVAPGQGCVVVYDGKVSGVLTEPDVYSMETANHPFITSLLNLAHFFRTAEVVNVLWGTASPVKYIEPDYKLPVTLGACGNFSIKIADAGRMFTTLLGTMSNYSVADVQELVSSRIVTPLSSFLAEKAYPYREVDSHLMDLSNELKERTAAELEQLGLELTDFRVNSVTFDEDTMERIGRIANMTAEQRAAAEVDLDYVSMQKLEALRDAARNEGGLAGAGLQLGAGVQLAKDVFKTQAADDSTERLRKLKKLLDEQLITEEEYEKKKNEILSQL